MHGTAHFNTFALYQNREKGVMEVGEMISQRRAVQLGVLSATAVFAACIGVLVFQGVQGDTAQDAKTQMVDAHSSQAQSGPLTLSTAAAPVVHLQSAQH